MILAQLPRSPSLVLVASFALFCTAASGQTAQGLQARALAATCANCHGTDGIPTQGDGMARLAGLRKEYIVTRMTEFREGMRPATVMHQISKGYSPEQIESLATYFSSRK